MEKNYEIDMCSGSIFPKIVRFSIPFILTNLLQLLYNAADMVVVGRFSGSTALAAVGSTTSLINLIVNIFIGLSLGTTIVLAQAIGSNNQTKIHKIVHTSILASIICGVFLSVFGILACRTLLTWMGAPADVLEQAVMYMKIYFLGMPGFMITSFGSAIMRTVGDTKRPLYFLSCSGIVNVILNLITVIFFKMGVAGVALATIVSQYISAILIIHSLRKNDRNIQLNYTDLKIHGNILTEIIKIGIPSGIQACMFSLSNVLIQSSINSFGSDAIAGSAASTNIESFIYTIMMVLGQTATTFVGQNYGAKKFDRVHASFKQCLLTVIIVGVIIGPVVYLFGTFLLSIYTDNTGAIAFGILRMKCICITYFLCGIMEVLSGAIRGTGSTVFPMISSIIGVCIIRILWLYTLFKIFSTPECLFISYPVSWVITSLTLLFFYLRIKRKLSAEQVEQ